MRSNLFQVLTTNTDETDVEEDDLTKQPQRMPKRCRVLGQTNRGSHDEIYDDQTSPPHSSEGVSKCREPIDRLKKKVHQFIGDTWQKTERGTPHQQGLDSLQRYHAVFCMLLLCWWRLTDITTNICTQAVYGLIIITHYLLHSNDMRGDIRSGLRSGEINGTCIYYKLCTVH